MQNITQQVTKKSPNVLDQSWWGMRPWRSWRKMAGLQPMALRGGGRMVTSRSCGSCWVRRSGCRFHLKIFLPISMTLGLRCVEKMLGPKFWTGTFWMSFLVKFDLQKCQKIRGEGSVGDGPNGLHAPPLGSYRVANATATWLHNWWNLDVLPCLDASCI